MNVRLSTELNLLASIHWMGEVTNNVYAIGLGLLTNTENNHEQNVAMSRIRYYINDLIRSGIFIDKEHATNIKQLNSCGFKTIILPEPPFDQSVATMLYCKLNAICEGKLIITDITVSSAEGDNVRFHHDGEDSFGPFAEEGWWNEADPSWCEHTTENPSGKVLELDRKLSWNDLGLGWDESVSDDGNVVIGNFGKKE